jgi:hypothetical protein
MQLVKAHFLSYILSRINKNKVALRLSGKKNRFFWQKEYVFWQKKYLPILNILSGKCLKHGIKNKFLELLEFFALAALNYQILT